MPILDTARAAAVTTLLALSAAAQDAGAQTTTDERFGALESGASSAGDELKTGFSDAWTAFSDASSAADEDASAN